MSRKQRGMRLGCLLDISQPEYFYQTPLASILESKIWEETKNEVHKTSPEYSIGLTKYVPWPRRSGLKLMIACDSAVYSSVSAQWIDILRPVSCRNACKSYSKVENWPSRGSPDSSTPTIRGSASFLTKARVSCAASSVPYLLMLTRSRTLMLGMSSWASWMTFKRARKQSSFVLSPYALGEDRSSRYLVFCFS